MKVALIATVFNEAGNLPRWWQCLQSQTLPPDEIVIVDGGSTDGTWETLQSLARESSVPVKLEQRRCNIAAGRNRAIELTDAEIIAANDAGSFPDPHWLAEITRPFLENKSLEVVGGHSVNQFTNRFQKYLELFEGQPAAPKTPEEIFPSSRNVAFRRTAWQDVGGYPEWLTLVAEDALFNFELHRIGKTFFHNPAAIVRWPVRETAEAYFRMLYLYGFGAAEARLYAPYFLKRTVIMLCPWLLIFSRHRCRHLGFRYRKNAASARGWLAGWLRGRRAPRDWRRTQGVLLSPAAQKYLAQTMAGNPR